MTQKLSRSLPAWALIRASAESLRQEGNARFSRQQLLSRAQEDHPGLSALTAGSTIHAVTIGAPSKPSRKRPRFLRRLDRGMYELEIEEASGVIGLRSRPSSKASKAASRLDGLKSSFTYYLESYDNNAPFRRENQLLSHLRVIHQRRRFSSVVDAVGNDEFLSSLHAVLRAWGIGSRGSRLAEPARLMAVFEPFLGELEALDHLLISDVDDPDDVINRLWRLVSTIPLVENKSRIVPVTKALHHLLPDLVVPIDRAWTGAFFAWNMPEFDQRPEKVFRSAYESFFDIARAVRPETYVGDGWRSSPAKIIDNGLVGFCLVNRIQPTSGLFPQLTSDGKALLSERFDRALHMASDLHRSQPIKGTESHPVPYLAHVLAVVAAVLADTADEDVAIAAALHDGPEDQGGRPVLGRIRNDFGDRVAEIVDTCTDTFDDPKPDWIPRKLSYLARLGSTPDRGALLVKCADCLVNARATLLDYRLQGKDIWTRFRMPCASNQLWWYESCRNALKRVSESRGYVQLDETVNSLLQEVERCPGCEYQHLTVHDGGDMVSSGASD